MEKTVRVAGTAVLAGSVEPGVSWIRGNVYKAGSTLPQLLTGQRVPTSRPERLVNGTGFYHTVAQPTYSQYEVSQVINVKDVAQHPVAGDGVTDETASLQAIINAAAETKKLVYFPHGIYLLSDTLVIPTGSRLVGEAWTQLSATGSRFANASRPCPMIQIGRPGDVGLAQLSDFVFTVADILPGAVLVEVNMAGTKPGDVALFNCHYRFGGARGSKTQTACANPQTCLAARLSLHLTQHSSAYVENSWSWTADHDLDGGSGTVYPGTAGGFLIEAQNGTWILGSGIGLCCFVVSYVSLLLIALQNTTFCTRSTSATPKTYSSVFKRARRLTGRAPATSCLPRSRGASRCWRRTPTLAGAQRTRPW